MSSETPIQANIMQSLKRAGWLVVRNRVVTPAGWPDIMALRNGRAIFIEVKKPGGIPTKLQQYRHRQIHYQGFEVVIARSITDIKHLL